MDRELIEYFDKQFKSFDEKLGAFDEKLGAFDEKLGAFDEKLESLERRFDEAEHGAERNRQEAEQRFDRLDGKIRQTHVLIEDVRSDVKGVAEGVVAGREELARHRHESEAAHREDKALLISLFRHGLDSIESRTSGWTITRFG